MKFCPECGSPVKDQMRFCTTCGADLTAHRESEARRAKPVQPAQASHPDTAPEIADFIIPIISESLKADRSYDETLALVKAAVKDFDPDG